MADHEADGILTQMHPSETSLGLNLGARSNVGSGSAGIDDQTFSQAGGVFMRNRRNLNYSTLDPAGSFATAVSGKSDITKTAHSSASGTNKMSLTPARRRMPKIHVGPGAITILSDAFWMEQ